MLGAQVKGIRGADGALRTIKDIGEYDVWSTVVAPATPAGELMAFSYSIGSQVSGSAAAANRLDTNMRTANSFVDESMNVYAIAVEIMRCTPADLTGAGVSVATYPDFLDLEAHTLFRFNVGGEKPFAEGMITWFAEAGGWYGNSAANAVDVVANNMPSIASARKWQFTLPIGRIEKFWGEFSWPRAGIALSQAQGVGIICRLLGIRARGVQ